MHNRDTHAPVLSFVRATLVTIVAMGMGCDGGKTTTPKDAGDAAPADAGDAAPADVGRDVGQDAGRDVGQDVPVADGPASPDTATPDLAAADGPQIPDLGPGIDTAKTDTAKTDGPPLTVDAGPIDSGTIDTPDAASMTQARITFAFQNTGTATVYLPMFCVLEFQVDSEVTATVYPNKSMCLCRCADPNCQGYPSCAPCAPREGIALAPGMTYEASWVAQSDSVVDTTGPQGAFKCVAYAPIPTGAYRVSLPVFASASDAAANLNAALASTRFQLTTANARVEVPLR